MYILIVNFHTGATEKNTIVKEINSNIMKVWDIRSMDWNRITLIYLTFNSYSNVA